MNLWMSVVPVQLLTWSSFAVLLNQRAFAPSPGQAEELIKRINGNPAINVTADWKLVMFMMLMSIQHVSIQLKVTLFIGSNDLCQGCLGDQEQRRTGNPFAVS